jgi:hypothetical protein
MIWYRGLKQGNRPVLTGTMPEDHDKNRRIEAERLYKRIMNPNVPEKQKIKAQRRLVALGIKLTDKE